MAPSACPPRLPRLDRPITPALPRYSWSAHLPGAHTCMVFAPAWSPIPTPFSALSTVHPALLGSSGVSCDPHWWSCHDLWTSTKKLSPSFLHPQLSVPGTKRGNSTKRQLNQEAEQGPWRVTWQSAITLETQAPSHLAIPPPWVHPPARNPTCAEGSVAHNCRRERESVRVQHWKYEQTGSHHQWIPLHQLKNRPTHSNVGKSKQLNATGCSGWILEQSKNICGKAGKIQIKSEVNSHSLMLISWFGQIHHTTEGGSLGERHLGTLDLCNSSVNQKIFHDFPGGPVVRGPTNARHMGSVPAPGRSNIPRGN